MSLLTDSLERQFAASRTDRISDPIDFRRLARIWKRARSAVRGSIPREHPSSSSTGAAAQDSRREASAPSGVNPTAAMKPRLSSKKQEHMAARLLQLAAGLTLYGVSESLMLAPAVGVDPWDVFHTGLAHITGIPVGTVLILVGGVVLLLWIPLRQRPGLGTVANMIVIGVIIDVMLGAMPALHALWLRWVVFTAGVLLNGVATGLYIGAGLGPGPRDGLTTGLAARGRSIRVVRTAIELSVLVAGWLLGGNVGAGTVLYAVGIGPLVHFTIPWFAHTPSTLSAHGSPIACHDEVVAAS